MASVLAWIVAVERHAPLPGTTANALLDFKAPVSQRALEWAEWLQHQPDTQLLLNLSVAPASPQLQRLNALRGRALNGADAHRADDTALRAALQQVKAAPLADTLLLLWLGHGITINRRRFLLHQDSADAPNLQSWDVDTLLQHLRSGPSPGLQIGVFDTCAQVVDVPPNNQQFGGAGKAQRRQHFFFAATQAALATLSPFEPTLTSMALEATKALPWPPQPLPLTAALQSKMSVLPSLPVAWEWTQGSGEQWSVRDSEPGDVLIAASIRRAGVSEAAFNHLWGTVKLTQLAATDLVNALKRRRVNAVAAKLQLQWPESASALRDAWARVQRAEAWVKPLADLGLALPYWTDLGEQVSTSLGRGVGTVPRFNELRELLLWALDAGDASAERTLLRLMVLAAKEAERSVAGAAPAVAALRALWQADAKLASQVAGIEADAQLQQRPLVLLVELALPATSTEPRVDEYWLLRDDTVEPLPKLQLSGAVGTQLNTLISHVLDTYPQALRVELLAPTALLAGRREWLSYSFDETPDAAADDCIGLDTLVPICWRWRDRMLGRDLRWQPALWRLRAKEAKARVDQSNGLRCLFDGEPPAAEAPPADVVALAYRPPGPAETGPRRAQFLQTLVRGHPYMVWPATEPADLPQLKAQLTQWMAEQRLLDLPERYRDARSGGALPHLVLFFDEPHRNPYTKGMGRLSTVAPAT